MKYYSKSPKEWEKIDEEKKRKRKDKYKTIKKYTTFLIILIAVLALIFTFFGSKLSRFNLSYNIVIDGVSFNLVTEDEFYYPDKITSEVNIQNTTNKKKEIKIDNFNYKIINADDNKTIYSFNYNESVNATINPYLTRLLFDLEKEKEISEIEAGKYMIVANFEFNGQKVNLSREFLYKQDFKLNFYSEENFYLKDENPNFKISLTNNSKDLYNKEIFGTLMYSKNDKTVYEQPVNFGSVELQPLESTTFDIKANKKFDSGTYTVMFDLKSLDKKIITNLNISNEINKTSENIAINDFTLQTFEKNQKLYYKAYLDNKVKKPQSIIMKSYGIKVQYNGEEIYNYKSTEPTRVYISEFGSTEIFDLEKIKEIDLDKVGRYFINFYVEIEGRIITAQNSIEVK